MKGQVDRGRPLPGHMGAVTISHGHTQKGHGQSREDLCPPEKQGQQTAGGSGHQATFAILSLWGPVFNLQRRQEGLPWETTTV